MGFIYDTIAREIAHVIALFSPSYANVYRQNHQLLKRGYSAAKNTGPNQRRAPKSTSAAAEIKKDWRRVTDSARELSRNNAYVAGMKRKFLAGVVGEGMWPKAKVADQAGNLLVELNKDLERRWSNWEETAGANGASFSDIQRLGAGHLQDDGEFLLRKVSVTGQPLAVQLLECDHLDTSKDADLPSGRIVGGIELDQFDKPVAYWLLPKHPGDAASTSVRVPATDVLHIFDRERVSQVRGICLYASVITDLADTVEFQDAILTLARVGTAYGIFIESPHLDDHLPPIDAQASESGLLTEYIDPARINKLLPGEKIGQTKPENPSAVYDPFVRSRLRSASAGTPLSYETFSNDYSQSTYSAARQAMLIERAIFRFYSGLLDRKLNLPVWRWFIQSQVAFGNPATGDAVLKLPGFEKAPRQFYAVKFSRPRQEWIDPSKEANSAQVRLDIGLETVTELCENEGRDIDEVLATRAAELQRMKELGITPTSSSSSKGAPNNDPQQV